MLLAREKELTQTLTRICQSQDSSLPSPRKLPSDVIARTNDGLSRRNA
jgi:hypothetical protein